MNLSLLYAVILVVICDIDKMEGIRWISTPSTITKCAHKTAHLTWEYVKEDNEEIRQFQWRFDNSTLIAVRGVDNGLQIDPKYHGRVNESGVNGILLTNITARDTGSYSLYIIIAWKEAPVIQSIWLNVMVAEAVPIPQWCTCERLLHQEWLNGGRNINVVTDGCSLEINSSHCCIAEPVNRCKDNNPQDLCIPFRGPITLIENATPVTNTNPLTEINTQNGHVLEGPKGKNIELNTAIFTALIAAIIIMLFISIVLNVLRYLKKYQSCTKGCQKVYMDPASILDHKDEQTIPMISADINNLEMQSYDRIQRKVKEDIKILEDYLNQIKSHKTLGEHISRVSTWTNTEDHSDYSSLRKVDTAYSDLSADSRPIRPKFSIGSKGVTQATDSTDV